MSLPDRTPEGPWTIQAILDSTRAIQPSEVAGFKTAINSSFGTVAILPELTQVEAIHPRVGDDTLNVMVKGSGVVSVRDLENSIYAGARTRSDALHKHIPAGGVSGVLSLGLIPLMNSYASRLLPTRIANNLPGTVVIVDVVSGHGVSAPVVSDSSLGAVFNAGTPRTSTNPQRSGPVGAAEAGDIAGGAGDALGRALQLSPTTIAAISVGGFFVLSLLGLYVYKQVRL